MVTELIAKHEPVEGRKQEPENGIKGVVIDADLLLQKAVASTTEEFSTMGQAIEEKFGEAKFRLDAARSAITEKARCTAGNTSAYVKAHPWKILGVAAVAGIVLGFYMRRR